MESLDTIKQFIESELRKNIESILNKENICHNHPPLREIVEGCTYCKKYGNVFVS